MTTEQKGYVVYCVVLSGVMITQKQKKTIRASTFLLHSMDFTALFSKVSFFYYVQRDTGSNASYSFSC
jgi:hypothetical protein